MFARNAARTLALSLGLLGILLTAQAAPATDAAPAPAAPAAAAKKTVNVNQASADELARLPRVGPSLAGKIVAHREQHGPFKRTEDLMEVKGIGEKTALKLLQEYGTLDRVIENAESIKPAHVGRKIAEGKEDALFSRELVRLASVPMEFSYDSLVRRGQDEAKLTGILLEMEFHQIIKELGLGSRISENSGYMPVGRDGLKDLAAALREAGDFVLDVETTSLDPLEAELVTGDLGEDRPEDHRQGDRNRVEGNRPEQLLLRHQHRDQRRAHR